MVGLIPIFVGFAARLRLANHIKEDDVRGDQVLPIAASHFLSEPFEILLLLGLISVNLAVAASATISQTTILSNNVLGRWLRDESGSPKRERACVIAVMIGSLIAAFSGESVMGLLEISLVIVMVALFVQNGCAVDRSRFDACRDSGLGVPCCGRRLAVAWFGRYRRCTW
jgi:Na+/proline symporter